MERFRLQETRGGFSASSPRALLGSSALSHLWDMMKDCVARFCPGCALLRAEWKGEHVMEELPEERDR